MLKANLLAISSFADGFFGVLPSFVIFVVEMKFGKCRWFNVGVLCHA